MPTMDVLPGFELCDCRCHRQEGNCGFDSCCYMSGRRLVKARCKSCGILVSEVAMANHACQNSDLVRFRFGT